jgi:predicted negative regulator of RcsB-dependent stress response
MIEKVRNWFREKGHIVVMTILVVYLIALAVKTGQVVYQHYQQEKAEANEPAPVKTP